MPDSDSEDHHETPAENAEPSPADYALGPMMIVMAWREGDTESTINDAIRDGPAIVGEIAAEIADERGIPRGWLTQIGHILVEPREESD